MKQFYFFVLLNFCAAIGIAQVTQVFDINDGSGNASPTSLTVFNGSLYFQADDSSGVNTGGTDVGDELWISDGTSSGTQLLKDIYTGTTGSGAANNSNPTFFFELNSELFFNARSSSAPANVWKTDGTDAGTVDTGNGFSILQPIIVSSKAYMTATTAGNTFYEFDGTTFTQVPDAGSGTANPIGGIYIALDANTILLYMSYSTDDATFGRELYKYDITNQTYTLVKDIDAGDGDSSISHIAKVDATVFFEADNILWQTDGTETGTIEVSTVNNLAITGLNNFYAWNGNLYFEGDDGNGDQLWQYNPIADSATNLSNIGGTNGTHDPSDYVAYNSWLYYSGEDADDSDKHLFRTNGTVIEQLDSTIKDVDDIVVFNNKLYFEGDDNSTGNELYSFDPATLRIETVNLNDEFGIHPNPSKNRIYVEINTNEILNYSIYDLNGRRVLNGNTINKTINHNLAAGVYVLQLHSKNNISTSHKFVVE